MSERYESLTPEEEGFKQELAFRIRSRMLTGGDPGDSMNINSYIASLTDQSMMPGIKPRQKERFEKMIGLYADLRPSLEAETFDEAYRAFNDVPQTVGDAHRSIAQGEVEVKTVERWMIQGAVASLALQDAIAIGYPEYSQDLEDMRRAYQKAL